MNRNSPGSRYYATGGPDPNHCYVGVDGSLQIQIPDPQPGWGPVYEVSMWHTGDWVIYHFKTAGPAAIKKIDLCLRNPPNPTVGTPIEIYVNNPAAKNVVPHHDEALPSLKRVWRFAGAVKIDVPSWKIYSISISAPSRPAKDLFMAVYLKEGERGPESGKDRNVYISWVKIYT